MNKKVILSDGREITIREPLVEDNLAVSEVENDSLAGIILVSNLTGLTEEEIRKMTFKDYRLIQGVVTDFLS